MTAILLKGLLGFSLILFVGSLLALVATLLPGLMERLEPGLESRAVGLGPREYPSTPAHPRETAAPAGPSRKAAVPRFAPTPQNPALAAAIALALALYQETGGFLNRPGH